MNGSTWIGCGGPRHGTHGASRSSGKLNGLAGALATVHCHWLPSLLAAVARVVLHVQVVE